MASETINLATLISMVPKELNIEIQRNSIQRLDLKCCCRPIGDRKDIDFISQFINLDIDAEQVLNASRNSQNAANNSILSDKPQGGQFNEDDAVALAKETKEMEKLIKLRD